MSKAIVATALGGTATAGTALVGAYSFGVFEGLDEIWNLRVDDWNVISQVGQSFESNNGGDCVQRIFKGVSLNVEGSNKLGISDGLADGAIGSVNSCLIISQLEQTEEQGWAGDFTFVWVLSKGDKGFIAHGSIGLEKPKQQFNSEFYFLNRQSSNGSGDISNVDKRENQTFSNGDEVLPNLKLNKTKGAPLVGLKKEERDKLATELLSAAAKSRSIAGYGRGNNSNTTSDVKNGSSNFDSGFTKVFSVNAKAIMDKFAEDTKGDWEELHGI